MTHLRVVPAKRAWLEALADSDEAFTRLTGVPVEPDWVAEFPGIVRYCLQRLDAGDDPAWSIHLFFDTDHGGALVGNGGWKGAPVDGVAELGYTVAPRVGTAGSPGARWPSCSRRRARRGSTPCSPTRCASPPRRRACWSEAGFDTSATSTRTACRCGAGSGRCSADDPVRMHVDEVVTDPELVRRLLRAQHPQWAELPITRVPSAGTDNAMYRLGDDLVARLPRIDWAVDNVAKEQRWVPALAPHLPLALPLPVAEGEPTEDFPYPWGIAHWIPGAMATLDELDDPMQAARDLAAFVRALRAIDPTDGPRHSRGASIRRGDRMVREGIAGLDGEVDVDALLRCGRRPSRCPSTLDRPPGSTAISPT